MECGLAVKRPHKQCCYYSNGYLLSVNEKRKSKKRNEKYEMRRHRSCPYLRGGILSINRAATSSHRPARPISTGMRSSLFLAMNGASLSMSSLATDAMFLLATQCSGVLSVSLATACTGLSWKGRRRRFLTNVFTCGWILEEMPC